MKRGSVPIIVGLVLSAPLLGHAQGTALFAYLDPGSGSYMLQILIAGLVGATFAVKTFWKNIRSFFSKLFSKKEDQKNGVP